MLQIPFYKFIPYSKEWRQSGKGAGLVVFRSRVLTLLPASHWIFFQLALSSIPWLLFVYSQLVFLLPVRVLKHCVYVYLLCLLLFLIEFIISKFINASRLEKYVQRTVLIVVINCHIPFTQILEENIGYLVGDCLIAAAFLSYAGPFLSNYRDELVEKTWLAQVLT